LVAWVVNIGPVVYRRQDENELDIFLQDVELTGLTNAGHLRLVGISTLAATDLETGCEDSHETSVTETESEILDISYAPLLRGVRGFASHDIFFLSAIHLGNRTPRCRIRLVYRTFIDLIVSASTGGAACYVREQRSILFFVAPLTSGPKDLGHKV